jgi:hypothetical protein
MFVRGFIKFDTTAFDLGAASATEVKQALAAHVRAVADRIERMNQDTVSADIVDDETGSKLGFVTVGIHEGSVS